MKDYITFYTGKDNKIIEGRIYNPIATFTKGSFGNTLHDCETITFADGSVMDCKLFNSALRNGMKIGGTPDRYKKGETLNDIIRRAFTEIMEEHGVRQICNSILNQILSTITDNFTTTQHDRNCKYIKLWRWDSDNCNTIEETFYVGHIDLCKGIIMMSMGKYNDALTLYPIYDMFKKRVILTEWMMEWTDDAWYISKEEAFKWNEPEVVTFKEENSKQEYMVKLSASRTFAIKADSEDEAIAKAKEELKSEPLYDGDHDEWICRLYK